MMILPRASRHRRRNSLVLLDVAVVERDVADRFDLDGD